MLNSIITDQSGELRPLALEDLPRPKEAPDGHALKKITQQVYTAVERALISNKINTVVVNSHGVHRPGRLTGFVCLANSELHSVSFRTVLFVEYTDPWQRNTVRVRTADFSFSFGLNRFSIFEFFDLNRKSIGLDIPTQTDQYCARYQQVELKEAATSITLVVFKF